jgi:rhomboid family protein
MSSRRWRPRAGRGVASCAFAWGYLTCFVITNLVYASLTPPGQAMLTAWASTNAANLSREPLGPLVLSAFIAPGYLLLWPVLIALAAFGSNRALGNARTTLICVAGHVVGTGVSEGIVAARVAAGQLPAADRHITDVGPSYVVVSAIVIAVICGTWLARSLALVDFAILVFGGHIFGGLSHLDVSAVGHLTAMLTATAIIAIRPVSPASSRRRRSSARVSDEGPDEIGDSGGGGAQGQLS